MMRTIFLYLFLSFLQLASHAQDDDFITFTLKGHVQAVNAVEFSRNDKALFSGGDDKIIKKWDLETGKLIKEVEAHFRAVKQITCLNDGVTIFSAGDRVVKSWTIDLEQQEDIWSHNTDVWSFDLTPDNKKMISATYESKVYLWDLYNNEIISRPEGHEENTLAVAFGPDGKYFASGSLDRKVFIWNTVNIEPEKAGIGHADNIYDVEFTKNGKYLASASRDKKIKIWETATGAHHKTLVGHTDAVVALSIHPNSRFLLSASYDGSIILWDLVKGENIYSYIDHDGPVNDVVFSHDGNFFASASADKKVIVYKFSPGVVANYYFEEELKAEFGANSLFDSKRKGESKTDFEERMKKAEIKKQEIYLKYFNKVFEQ